MANFNLSQEASDAFPGILCHNETPRHQIILHTPGYVVFLEAMLLVCAAYMHSIDNVTCARAVAESEQVKQTPS